MFSLSIPSPRLPLRRPWGGRRIASRIGDIFHHLWCHKRPPIASGGSGWKDTTGPGCWSAGIFLVDSLKFGTDFRLNHTWKNGRSAFAFLGTGWAIFLGDVCTSSKFFHLSLYREGRTKVQRPYLCLTVTHVRLSKNRVIQIHWSLCFTSETRHRKSQCTPTRVWRSGRLTFWPSQNGGWKGGTIEPRWPPQIYPPVKQHGISWCSLGNDL